MRVLVLTRVWPTAANPHSGTWVRDQVNALERLDIECEVVHVVGNGGLRPYWQLLRAMRTKLDEGRFDLVHAHYGFTGVVAATQRRLPTVVTFHGSDVLGRSFEGAYRRAFGRIEALVSKQLARRVDHAIVVSQLMQNVLGAPRVTVAQMGIDLAKFKRMPRTAARAKLGLGSAPIVVFVGDPALKRKRFDLAKAAFDVVHREIPSAQLMPVYGRNHEEVVSYMNAADALILTSYVEGSPTVVKEAMACELPVVSVPVGDVREQLRGVTPSYVVDPDPQSLATALLEVLRGECRSNGRSVVTRFTNETIAVSLAELYRRIAGVRTEAYVKPMSTSPW